MVMIFQSEQARNFLLKNGIVFTFRLHKRKHLGNDWITDKRGHKKIANVVIKELAETQPRLLGIYQENSGFDSLKKWIEEIIKLNKGKKPKLGWVYRVTLR